MRSVLSTGHLEPSERFGFWHDMLAQATSPLRARTRFTDSFDGTLHHTSSTAFNLLVAENHTVDVARTLATIRQADPGVFYLLINYRGVQQFVVDRDMVELGPCDMVLLHTSLSLYSRSDPQLRRQRGATVFVSPDVVPGGERRLRQLIGRRLSGEDSLVSFLAQHLYLVGTRDFDHDAAEQVYAVSSSLISLVLARQLQAETELPYETRGAALGARVRSYIQANLADPALSAGAVAAAHHISTRTLHRIFESDGVPFTALIRQLRLDQCRREITDPHRIEEPVRSIARRWGFPDASHFSRAYKAAFGISPSDERARAISASAPIPRPRRSPPEEG